MRGVNVNAISFGFIVGTASLAFVVSQLDVSIVNIALPQISKSFSAGVSALQWIVDAYTIAFAVLMLSAGAMSDLLGSKRLFQLGLLVFVGFHALVVWGVGGLAWETRRGGRFGLPGAVPLAVMVQGVAVALEPGFGLIRPGAQAVHHAPEALRVVHLLEMTHLVGGEVVEHESRRHDQPPGETERTRR